MNDKLVYDNEHYEVLPNPEYDGYWIRNKSTSVFEGRTEVLPAALSKADMWSQLLKEFYEKNKDV